MKEQFDNLLNDASSGQISGYVHDALQFAQGAAVSAIVLLFAIVLVVVISIYMLLDMPRLEQSIDRRFPPHGGLPLTQRIERALWGYVKGQLILSTVIGASAGIGMWILGKTGLVEGRRPLRAALRRLDGVHRGDPLHRPVALGGAARPLRARGRPGRLPLGAPALRLHLPDRRVTSSCRT